MGKGKHLRAGRSKCKGQGRPKLWALKAPAAGLPGILPCCTLDRWLWARQRQCLTLVCTRESAGRLSISTKSGQLQTTKFHKQCIRRVITASIKHFFYLNLFLFFFYLIFQFFFPFLFFSFLILFFSFTPFFDFLSLYFIFLIFICIIIFS